MSKNVDQGNYIIALKILLYWNLDVTIRNNEGQKAVQYLDKSSPLYKLLIDTDKKRAGNFWYPTFPLTYGYVKGQILQKLKKSKT
jgi:hypothetical protein